MSTDRQLPPQDIESEMSVLGAIFVDNEAIGTAHEILKVEDFYRESHRRIFDVMSSLADRSEPVDLVTVTSELRKRGELEEVGGGAYMAVLVDFVPMASNVAHYCRLVAEKATERRLIVHAQDAIQFAYKGGMMDEALAKLEDAIQPVLDKSGSSVVQIGENLKDAINRIKFRYENKGMITGLSYGLSDLDKVTLGMHPGELIIIAGRPSMGKTALAYNIVKSACEQEKATMLFALEMTRTDTVDRIFATYGVKYQNLRSGMLTENDWPKIKKASDHMARWTFPIDDTSGISLRELKAKARRQYNRGGLDLVVIDYLQLMSLSDPRMNRVQGIGEISRGLKQLAKDLMIPVVLLSQLNRGVDSRPDKRPMMSDLRDSGEIEQDADVILFPYRPAAYCEQCKDRIDDHEHNYKEHQAKAEIIIEKQRAGERNISIPAVWMGEYQRFESFSRYSDLPD